MTKITLGQSSSLVFRACDDLRGNMDALECKLTGSVCMKIPETAGEAA
jgi:hypothetical protein